jgi:hypothetical protein
MKNKICFVCIKKTILVVVFLSFLALVCFPARLMITVKSHLNGAVLKIKFISEVLSSHCYVFSKTMFSEIFNYKFLQTRDILVVDNKILSKLKFPLQL